MNQQEYIEFAKKNEVEMISAIRVFHPYHRDLDRPNKITAKAAEAACETIRQEIRQETQYDTDPVTQYKQYDADAIVSIANAVWFGMPESFESRSHPAFGIICDLAEGYEEC